MHKIKNFFKNVFSPTNWKRVTIAVITLISAILAIVFGSTFYVSKNVNKSVEYGGGVEFLVQVKNLDGTENVTQEFTNNVADQLDSRLTGGVAFNGVNVQTQNDGKITITKNGALSDDERKKFEELITDKPTLVLTTLDMTPLFINGQFNENQEKIDYANISKFVPPLKPAGASAEYIQQTGGYEVKVDLLDNDAQIAWSKATEYVASRAPQSTILMWLNLDELVQIAKDEFPTQWKEAQENPYNFVYVTNSPFSKDGQSFNSLKIHEINGESYLISQGRVSGPLTGESFTISGQNFTEQTAKKLASNINFGTAKYELDFLSSNYINPSTVSGSFEKALLAGAIVFALIAIFMIVNYGLLGALSTISMALYMFLTLLMFTILRGEYSPVTIAALVIGIGIGVDANIILFERLKSEVYAGEKLIKAMKNSSRMSMSSIIDANLTTLIVSFILFYFGTSTVRGFSLSLVFSVIFTLVVMLFLTRWLANLIVRTGYFNKRLWLLGIKYKKINNLKANARYRQFDYVGKAKWFILGSVLFVVIGTIIFVTIAAPQQDVWAGFNRSLEFQGGINISIEGQNIHLITQPEAQDIHQWLIDNQEKLGIQNMADVLTIKATNSSNTWFKLDIQTSQDLTNSIDGIKAAIKEQYPDLNVWSYGISPLQAQNLVKNALLAVGISFIGIITYTLVRLKWTFSIAAIVGLLHDVILTVAFIVVTRLQLSPILVAAILSIIAFSINDTIVVFDRIREKIHTTSFTGVLTKAQVKEIANSSIVDTIKRSLFTSLTTILAVLVLLAFKDATAFSFNLVMIFGLAIGAYSSIFICTWLWTKLETRRQKGIQARMDKKYWKLPGPDEQVFVGINDFVA
ncbi:protein translocase subunit SecDF [Mycoplasmopsis columbinasalis]|uniref:Bifunctional preprotein translocase subunit SecD/SecF n=1 Tax=Mycoplasmopsis columbinasalis TaxID=114880 RepID=A0A449BAN9_9BACT|nr:protein translocase subunit SecDF [Mycoplasmopsis columbinasalis]VEU78272.1 bifunctional preprotein translocase subunit SecD/SecF [Mycoplasmopsis columbinasalis]